MDKKILEEYIDACELIKESEAELKQLRIRGEKVVRDSVKASMHDYPYAETRVHLEGIEYKFQDRLQKHRLEKILEERKEKAEKVKEQVEEFMNSIPLRMQRIIKYKYFEGLSWEDVAKKMGSNYTGEGIRKEVYRFLKEK